MIMVIPSATGEGLTEGNPDRNYKKFKKTLKLQPEN